MAQELIGSMNPGDPAVVPGDYNPAIGDPMQGIVTDSEGEAPAEPVNRNTGWLLEEADEAKVAKKVVQWWKDQEAAMQDRKTRWRAFRWWRQGKRFVRLVMEAERARVYAPPQSASLPPSPNLCDSLIRKIVATIMVDPPRPECEPPSADDSDRDAAELSERLLEDFGSDRQMTVAQAVEDALDKAATYCSAFIYAEVTPNGRMEPVEVEAHPMATDPANPLVNPTLGFPDGQVVLKYEQMDGTLGDNLAMAKREWTPDVDLCVLTGHHVRMLPQTAAGLYDAYGVLVMKPMTLGTLKALTPDAPWGDELAKKVAAWRPEGWQDTLPISAKEDVAAQKTEPDGKISDDTLCFPLKCYLRETADYEHGAYLIVVNDTVLYRGPWGGEAATGTDEARWETFGLPVVQVRFMDDHQGDDPYGTTLVEKLGPMDDILATQLASVIQFSDRVNKPREYLPIGTIVQPDQLRRRDGRPIFYNKDAGQPVIETLPTYPPVVQWVIEYMTQQMNLESGLTPQAQGMATPSVRSNQQQQALIERSIVNVANIKRNTDAATISLWQLILQLYRVYFTRAQRVRYVGADGAYKEREWTRADLRGTSDVRVKRGSSTMMPLSAKQEVARAELEIGLKAKDPLAYLRYQQVMSGRLDPVLGLQQDKTMQRVRAQIEAWGQGPPEETVGNPEAEFQAAVAIFAPLPVDDDPTRALVRYRELSQAMETETFRRYMGNPGWSQAFTQAWLLAKQAAGIMTIQEQQEAQNNAALNANKTEAEGEGASEDAPEGQPPESQG